MLPLHLQKYCKQSILNWAFNATNYKCFPVIPHPYGNCIHHFDRQCLRMSAGSEPGTGDGASCRDTASPTGPTPMMKNAR